MCSIKVARFPNFPVYFKIELTFCLLPVLCDFS